MSDPIPQHQPLLATTSPQDDPPLQSALRTPQSAMPTPIQSQIGNRKSPPPVPFGIQHSALSIQHSSDVPLDTAVEHLTIPQRAALTAIIEGRPVTTAAKEAGVHRATVHRWLQKNPVFRAAYNAWEHESKTNTMSRLLAIVKKALDAVTWSIDEGDGRLAYTLLKDLGLLTQIQPSLTDPKLLGRQMHLDHLNLLHSLHLLLDQHEDQPHPIARPPHRSPAD